MEFLFECLTRVEHEKRNFMSTSNHVLFYHINTIALYWQEKSTLLLNESCRFLLSAARNAITKATEFVTFSFSFRILEMDVTVCKRYEFFRVLAAIIHTNPDKRSWIENGESFTVHSSTLTEWRERRVTYQQLIGDIKHTWKKIRHIFTSVVATFLSAFHINHSLYEKSHLSRGKIELKNGIACPLGTAVYLRYFKSFKIIYEDLSVRVSVAWFGVGIARSAKIYHHNETCAPHRRNSKIICKITKDNTLASPL